MFADGSSTTVSWRDREQTNKVEPPYAMEYERLVAMAKAGDAEAAYRLYEILGEACRDAAASEQELADSIELVYQAHTVAAPGHDRRARISDPDKVKAIVTSMESTYQSCIGITAERKSEADMWLELAATNGYSFARLRYGSRLRVPDLAIRQLEFAWRDGEAEALGLLYERYRLRAAAGGDRADQLRSYAVLYAYAALQAASLAEWGMPSPWQIDSTRSRLNTAAETLTADELNDAIEMAKDYVTNNLLCCYKM